MGIGQETPLLVVEWISQDRLGYVAVTNDPQITGLAEAALHICSLCGTWAAGAAIIWDMALAEGKENLALKSSAWK